MAIFLYPGIDQKTYGIFSTPTSMPYSYLFRLCQQFVLRLSDPIFWYLLRHHETHLTYRNVPIFIFGFYHFIVFLIFFDVLCLLPESIFVRM